MTSSRGSFSQTQNNVVACGLLSGSSSLGTGLRFKGPEGYCIKRTIWSSRFSRQNRLDWCHTVIIPLLRSYVIHNSIYPIVLGHYRIPRHSIRYLCKEHGT